MQHLVDGDWQADVGDDVDVERRLGRPIDGAAAPHCLDQLALAQLEADHLRHWVGMLVAGNGAPGAVGQPDAALHRRVPSAVRQLLGLRAGQCTGEVLDHFRSRHDPANENLQADVPETVEPGDRVVVRKLDALWQAARSQPILVFKLADDERALSSGFDPAPRM